jgi:1-acyl-sn-glycerol-3-phosphate acyltransferase
MSQVDLPRYSRFAATIARWYIPRFVRKHFHAVLLDRDSVIPPAATPTVIYLNHPSWWDPLLGAVLACRFYPHHRHYSPIDSDSLQQYPVMRKLGFFPVRKHSARGSADFLRVSREVLTQKQSILWVTPQGDFVDALTRPVVLKPGIGHLARDVRPVVLIPMAVEYVFWEDRLPEALIRLGPEIVPANLGDRNAAQWTDLLTEQLEHEQNMLRAKAAARVPDGFHALLSHSAHVGGIYDIRMRLSGKKNISEMPRHRGADKT